MDDKKKLDEEVLDEPKRGSGSLLAAARKQQNKTVEEIADELNLSVTQIRTIELDQSEGLPEPTYVRGYIRLYARVLGLDVDEVLDHYLNPNWQKGTRLDDMPRGIGSASEIESRGFFTAGKVFVIIVLVGILSFLWVTGKLDDLLGRKPTTMIVPASTVSASSDASPQVDLGQLSPELVEDNVNIDTATGADQGVSATGAENQLSLTFSDTSWVDVRDGDGNRLAYKSYAQGERLTVTAPTSMSVFLGNAEAVTASYNGVSYDISKYREGVFARFSVGE